MRKRPVVGSFINYFTSWRWTYYVVIIVRAVFFLFVFKPSLTSVLQWSTVELVLLVIFNPETHRPTLLRQKASRLSLSSPSSSSPSRPALLTSLRKSILTPFVLLIHEPMALLLDLWTSLLLAILYLFFNVFPIVFQEGHGLNQWQGGLMFLGLGAGLLAGAFMEPIWRRFVSPPCSFSFSKGFS